MKHKMYSIFMVLTSHFILAQSLHYSKEEKEAFLLGMLNHFNGDVFIPKHPILKDRLTFFLNGKEKMIKIFKDSISVYGLENNFKYVIRENNFTELYKLEENNPFEKYYKKKRHADDFYSDENDDKVYELYFLELDKRAFKSKKLKMSFLLGAFINNGKIVYDNVYFFKGNSTYIDFLINLLKELKIEITKIELPNNGALGGLKVVNFSPSDEFSNLLKKNKKLWEK